MLPYHPELASTEQANSEENRLDIRSDHVPILTITPENFKIVSWNVMQSSQQGCGFAPESTEHANYVETSDRTNARHQNIIDGLANFAKNIDPDFIALQEISLDTPTLLNNIPDILAKYNYTCVKIGQDIANGWGQGQGIILYKQDKFELEIDADRGTNQFNQGGLLAGVKATFKSLSNENTNQCEKLTLLSIHAAFRFAPNEHEAAIKKFMRDNTKNGNAIIIGDFNCPIAPLDSELRNITTSVSPPLTHNYGIQGGYPIDGAIYLTPTTCQQLMISHLNPAVGAPYSAKDLTALEASDVAQISEIKNLRMTICVDTKYNAEKFIDSKTIFEYEDVLKKSFNNDLILVRRAANLNNEKGVGINLPYDIFNLFKSINPNLQYTIKYDFMTKRPTNYCVFAFDSQILDLVKLAQLVLEKQSFLATNEGKFRTMLAQTISIEFPKLFTGNSSETDEIHKETLMNLQFSITTDLKTPISLLLENAKKLILYGNKKPNTSLTKTEKEKQIITFLNNLIKKVKSHENNNSEQPQCRLQ